jgi:hypothetical protein
MAPTPYNKARSVDSDVSALAAEVFYTGAELGEHSPQDDDAAYDALMTAQYSHADLLRFAQEWDAQAQRQQARAGVNVATCTTDQALRAMSNPHIDWRVKAQLREEFE